MCALACLLKCATSDWTLVPCSLSAAVIERIASDQQGSFRAKTVTQYQRNWVKRYQVRAQSVLILAPPGRVGCTVWLQALNRLSRAQPFLSHGPNGRKRKEPLQEFLCDGVGIATATRFMQDCVGKHFPGQEKTARALVRAKAHNA